MSAGSSLVNVVVNVLSWSCLITSPSSSTATWPQAGMLSALPRSSTSRLSREKSASELPPTRSSPTQVSPQPPATMVSLNRAVSNWRGNALPWVLTVPLAEA